MKVLSIDSSAVTASACLTDGENVIGYNFINNGLTHSETLLPIIKDTLGNVNYDEIDEIAISVGPGSFTGVRIGIALAKGIAFNKNIPCVPVSTLEAIAYNFVDENCTVCAVMDARRNQFYNAIFSIENGVVSRCSDDRAVDYSIIEKDLEKYENVIVAGDGADLFFDLLKKGNNIRIANNCDKYQSARGVFYASKQHKAISSNELTPVYLRLSQAERELKLKRG